MIPQIARSEFRYAHMVYVCTHIKPIFYHISEKDTESWKDENFQTVKQTQTKKKVIKINMDMDQVPMYQMYGIISEVSY